MRGINRSVLPLLLLSACGGSDPVEVSEPIMTVPAPTPTPTATSAPSFIYTRADDFTADRSYQGLYGYITAIFDYVQNLDDAPDFPSLNDNTVISLTYAAATDALTLRFPVGSSAFGAADVTFNPADRLPGVAARSYSRGDDRLTIGAPAGTSYVARVGWRTRGPLTSFGRLSGNYDTTRIALFGAPTDPADALPSGVGYRTTLFIRSTDLTVPLTDPLASTTTTPLTLAIAADGVTMTGNVSVAGSSSGYPAQSLRFSGTLNRTTNRIVGKIEDTSDIAPTGHYSGDFAGRLFGPRGSELGLTLRISRSDLNAQNVRIYVGDITGVR